MPTYEYLCETCGSRFEVWQRMSEDPLTECPTCQGHVRRVLYPAGIVFKGSGFYKTDNTASSSVASASSNGKDSAASAASDAAPSNGSSGSSSSTSAAKSETAGTTSGS